MSPRAGLDGCEKFALTGIRSPVHPARSEALYRLRYQDTPTTTFRLLNLIAHKPACVCLRALHHETFCARFYVKSTLQSGGRTWRRGKEDRRRKIRNRIIIVCFVLRNTRLSQGADIRSTGPYIPRFLEPEI